jgi:predicted RNA-binding protein with PUA-like domain
MPKRPRAVSPAAATSIAAATAKRVLQYWLIKSEPDVFSIADLKSKKVEGWDGVRNYQARNNMKKMKVGDVAFFYHSNAKPSGIVGLCTITREAYPDESAWNPKAKYFDPKASPENPIWSKVDVSYLKTLPRMITLDELKSNPKFSQLTLVRSSRLSVQPVTEKEFNDILSLVE